LAKSGSEYIPERGDIVWLQLTPIDGHEQAGHRPCLVISATRFNQVRKLAFFCPITSNVQGYPFEVPLPENLKVSGAVLSDQLKCLDFNARPIRFICKAPEVVVTETVAKIKAIIE